MLMNCNVLSIMWTTFRTLENRMKNANNNALIQCVKMHWIKGAIMNAMKDSIKDALWED